MDNPKEVLITFSGMTEKILEIDERGSVVLFHLSQLYHLKGNRAVEFRVYLEYPNEYRVFFTLTLSEREGDFYITELPLFVSVADLLELSTFIIKHKDEIYSYLNEVKKEHRAELHRKLRNS